MPTSGASVSRNAGPAEMRSVSVTAARGSTVSTVVVEPLLEAATHQLHLVQVTRGAPARGAREKHAHEAGPAQPILVVHGGLMDQIGQRAVGLGGAIAEEDQVRPAQNREADVVGCDVDEQPVARQAGRVSPPAPR